MGEGKGRAELGAGIHGAVTDDLPSTLFSSTQNAVGYSQPTFTLKNLLMVYEHKDRSIKHYLETNSVKVGDREIPLAQIREHNQKKRYAQYLNLTDTFNKLAGDSNLKMAFVTVTLKDLRFTDDDVEIVKYQSLVLRHFHRTLRDERLFRQPTQRLLKMLGMKSPWYYIPADRFQYIYTLEFQKDLTLHSHCAYYIPDSFTAFSALYETFKRKKGSLKAIGRVEFVIPSKFKSEFVNHFDLVRFDTKQPDCYVERGVNVKCGDFLYIKFINDNSKYQQDYFTQIMRYITKYVMKGIGMKEDGTGTKRERNEEVLIRYNRLRMISFSRLLVPFFVYNKFYKELQMRNISLYGLMMLKKQGKANWQIDYEDLLETYSDEVICDSLDEYSEWIIWLYENKHINDKLLEEYACLYKTYFDDQYMNPSIECYYECITEKRVYTLMLNDEIVTV